jgi:hypothetical protein
MRGIRLIPPRENSETKGDKVKLLLVIGILLTSCGVSSSGSHKVKIHPSDISYIMDSRGNCFAYVGIISDKWMAMDVKGIGLAHIPCEKDKK